MEDCDIFKKCELNTCAKGPIVTDNNTGEILCASCGQVLIEKTDSNSPDGHFFDFEQLNERSRTGIKTSLAMHDRGLATSINSLDKDASGKYLTGYMKSTFHRLRIWDNRSKSEGSDRNLRHALMMLDAMKSNLALPDNVVEEAAYIYRKILTRKLTRGRKIETMLCAAIYASCRKNNTPRTLRDIAKVGNVTRGDLAHAYRVLVNNLDLRINPYDPVEFITKICSMIDVSEKTRRLSLSLILKAEENGFATGKNPMSLVAAAIYVACCVTKENKTQIQIAQACGVSNVAVRNLAGFFKKTVRRTKIFS